MSIRTLILQQLANTLANGGVASTDYSLEATELPWTASGDPLYVKNMRVVYVSEKMNQKFNFIAHWIKVQSIRQILWSKPS